MTEPFIASLWADRYLMAGLIAGALSVAAFIPYVRDTYRGQTKPDRACWLIWSVLASISGASNLYEGANTSLIFVGVQVLGTLLVFALAIRFGEGGFMNRNGAITLGIAGLGLVSWAMMDTAAVALLLAIAISALGGVRTIYKSYVSPETESNSAWWLLTASAGFGVMSVGSMDPLLLAYPVYLLGLYGGIVLAMMLGRWAAQEQAEEDAREVRRRFVPPLTAVPAPVFERTRTPLSQARDQVRARLAA